MRAESDVQGPFRSEAPACDHCGFPLLEQAEYCPYCERPLGEAVVPDGADRRSSGVRSERVLLIAAGVLCAALAVVSIAAAMLV